MARDESNREDLLREATALVERIELMPRTTVEAAAIMIGFRVDGALSVFFGEDPTYQFNASCELRRAYCAGLLFKAVNGRLVSLRRERTATETQLVRHELTAAEQDDFMASMRVRLSELSALLKTDTEVRGQIPPDADVLGRVRAWFEQHRELQVARRPNL